MTWSNKPPFLTYYPHLTTKWKGVFQSQHECCGVGLNVLVLLLCIIDNSENSKETLLYGGDSV